MFESIFTSTADNSINISQAAISLGASIVIGVIIAIVYMYICKKEGYQKNFIIGLLMLPAVVSVVMFDKYTSENRLNKVKTTNMGTMYELTYEIRLKNDDAEKDFIDELRVRNGNLNISVGIMPENSVSALN